jgi:hypothetical protein
METIKLTLCLYYIWSDSNISHKKDDTKQVPSYHPTPKSSETARIDSQLEQTGSEHIDASKKSFDSAVFGGAIPGLSTEQTKAPGESQSATVKSIDRDDEKLPSRRGWSLR